MNDESQAPLVGEITHDAPQMMAPRAADGGIVPAAATTAGQFLDLVGDGEFSAEVHAALRNLAAEMQDQFRASGKPTKGKVVVSFDFEFEDRMFKIKPDVKVTLPKQPRSRSIMFADEHNRFTRFPPGQAQMFGVRSVPSGSGGLRQV
jgi:hypothetical protein